LSAETEVALTDDMPLLLDEVVVDADDDKEFKLFKLLSLIPRISSMRYEVGCFGGFP
jgi:hypothetical protein